jgi:cytochrome c553
MRPVVNALTIDDMVALAAYVGALPPSGPRRR